jgi:hypothetical protein
MKFKVYLEQFGTVIVEAETEEEANKTALHSDDVHWYEPFVHEMEPLETPPE